jgi:negative regulator of replication initiation
MAMQDYPFDVITADEYDRLRAAYEPLTESMRRLVAAQAEAFIERTEGIKTYARGYLGDAQGHTVEADGVFIRPAWARDSA